MVCDGVGNKSSELVVVCLHFCPPGGLFPTPKKCAMGVPEKKLTKTVGATRVYLFWRCCEWRLTSEESLKVPSEGGGFPVTYRYVQFQSGDLQRLEA